MTNETKRPTIIVRPHAEGIEFDVDGVGVLRLDVNRMDTAIRERAMFHGFEQKVRDAAAIGYTQKDGTVRRPSSREKYDAMRAVIETLESGEWNKRREGGVSDGGLLFEALCRMYDGTKDATEVRAWLDKHDEKTKANLRRNPKVADMIAKIRAERNPDAATVAEDLLASFEAE